METSVPAGPLGVVATVAIAVLVILFVIWVIRRDTIRKQRAVRSPDYWKERPDGRRYPTGWDQSPGAGGARKDPGEGPAGDDGPPPEGGDPPTR
ncbi:hypothetical protein [Nocardiopsis lambiniae]|uniref:Secreted protein n=1 Tax=Nocardiopsis lambiniae TaxID=3075539 RepID=A0ABU2MCR9_9ACTN|nr:hypothetical protein [Nocardiopsis sp. DSM 44743]MDT0329915.1 hypothetical protein [Nocardiopsis sp. DSM 44743]